MPHPIPEWDVERILIQFIANRQLKNNPPTLQEISRRIGYGMYAALNMLGQQGVAYSLLPDGAVYYKNHIVLTSIPAKLVTIYGFDKKLIEKKGREIQVNYRETPAQKRQHKKEREAETIRNFLDI